MKVIVATTDTQKQRKSDFCFVPEGEILKLASECSRESIDGPHGGRRSMTGIQCLKGTTTMKVVDIPMSIEDLTEKLKISATKACGGDSTFTASCMDEAKELARIAAFFPVGTILEKRGNNFKVRKG